MATIGWEERDVTLKSGLKLHVAEAGAGPLVILLHGFPDHWRVWRFVLAPLAEAGFRVVAPDMRGYDRSDKPGDPAAYKGDAVAADIADLIDRLGGSPATVVGHDWGGVIAWRAALKFPEHIRKLGIINAPHPFVNLRELSLDQLMRSSYILFFQLPVLPETLFSAFDHALLRQTFRGQSDRPGRITDEDVEASVQALALPGALTAALNYYRMLPWEAAVAPEARIELPILILWGEKDPYLRASLAVPSPERVPNVAYFPRGDAGHWLQLDEPEWVVKRLVDFCTETTT